MSEYCFQIVLPSIQKFYKSDGVNEPYDDDEAGDGFYDDDNNDHDEDDEGESDIDDDNDASETGRVS